MNSFSKKIIIGLLMLPLNFCFAQSNSAAIYQSKDYSVFADSVVQNKFTAKAISSTELASDYTSMYPHNEADNTSVRWQLSRNTKAFPQYQSEYAITNAIYNLSLEEMIKAVEPDSTFRTGKLWAGVWTRDISYSIILSMAYLQPKVAMNSLMKKVNKDGKIIQDTGTGGAYPCSTDRMIWAVAAWNVYEATGDIDWLKKVYVIIKNSIDDDISNAYDPVTGLVHGESSFLDWREQTYPKWMQPADIYESENLGTNAVHYEANIVVSKMAHLLNDEQASLKYATIAKQIKKAINQYFWMKDKGYYAQYLYGRNYKIISPRAEALGEALSILFNIADASQQQSIIENTPVTAFGISCIYPQIPGIPPYHNNAVWPFVEAYWALASAKVHNEQSVITAISAIDRAAALFLTNKENFVADNGDYGGTQINSSNMLWSLSGNLSMIHKIIFGIEFQPNKLLFHPFVPKALQGKRSLKNFKYRKAILNIEMEGYGDKIKSFSLDNKHLAKSEIPATLTGEHNIKIVLANNIAANKNIHRADNYVSPETPLVTYSSNKLSWQNAKDVAEYIILKNGKEILKTGKTEMDISKNNYAEYQVIALDKNGVQSFASEPVAVIPENGVKLYQAESFAPKAIYDYKGFSGEGFVEISKTVNRMIQIPVKIKEGGLYSIDVRYANGNGPINTENKCAIRTLKIDKVQKGTFVFPQRGKDDWNIWGYSNSIHVYLTKGTHNISITFDPANENMNGDINQAMIDYVRTIRIGN